MQRRDADSVGACALVDDRIVHGFLPAHAIDAGRQQRLILLEQLAGVPGRLQGLPVGTNGSEQQQRGGGDARRRAVLATING
ncbi:hypothetical protein WT36_21990 [Burkholderia territorii]|nr:hypothetical protein WT36_21990 [Burkholderia territorii]